jgi:uncharacterized protein
MAAPYPAPWPPPVAGDGEPAPALEYHELQRGARRGVWRPLLGVAALALLVLLILPVPLIVVFAFYYGVSGVPRDELMDRLTGVGEVVPSYLAFVNLTWALAIPATLLVAFVLHRMRPGWVASVTGRMRWGWMGTCFGLSLVALVATLVVSALLPSGDSAVTMSGEPNPWTSTVRDFVLVVVLLTPLQAAGEEYVFRGYLTQAFGGLVRSRIVAVVVPALLFACAHGLGQDLPVFVDRFAFGLVAGWLVILTGGLEAGIAMHVLNNWLAFGLALAYGDMATTLNPTGGSWWSIPVTLTQSLVYLGLAVLVSRRMGLATTTTTRVLEAPPSHV